MNVPAVSVIIPTYNRSRYIADAIGSILAQDFTDFELVIVDDGSIDETATIVGSFADPRIRLVRHERNRGIPAARNTGLDEARGEFIAWLDSDDRARRHRLRTQLAFLRTNPQVAMVGSCAGKMTPAGVPKRGTRVPPLSSADIGAWLLFRTAFQQSSIMGRADVLKACRYRAEYPVLEDLDVYIRLAREHRLENMPVILIDRRIHPEQTIRLSQGTIHDRSLALLSEALCEMGMAFTDEDLRRHIALAKPWAGGPRVDADYLDWAEDWMTRLQTINRETRYVDPDALRLATGFFWFLACHAASTAVGRLTAIRRFSSSHLAGGLFSSHASAWVGKALPLVVKGQIPGERLR